MGLLRSTRNLGKHLFNVPSWIGYRQLRFMTRGVWNFSKGFFIPKHPKCRETFEEALVRFGLTEQDLQQRIKEFTGLTILWLILFFLDVVYALYLAWKNSWLGFFPTMGISLILLTQAFRYQFFIFQIRQRKLGCKLHDWFTAYFGGE